MESYQRLPGRGRRLSGTDFLWLGEGHLLLARQRIYTETYQRFYFGDIQALIVSPTRARAIGTAVAAGLIALSLVPVWFFDSLAARISWLGVAAVFLVIGLVNWLRGPTVRCHLVTRLHTVELRALNRRPVARRVVSRLKRLIEEAQGSIATMAPPSPLADAATAAVQMEPSPAVRAVKPPPLPTEYNGLWHLLLFVALLSDSAVTSWQLASESLLADGVGIAVFLVEITLAIIAVLRQRIVRVSRRLRLFAGSALAFMVLMMIVAWVAGMVVSFQAAFDAARTGDPIQQAALYTQLAPLSWVSLVGTTLLGVGGLVALLGDRGRGRSIFG